MQTLFLAGGGAVGAWFFKLLFTAVTVGSGFKGGEVTPLFFIGASLGYAWATWTGLPVDLMAAVGFAAVFAAATKTPWASAVMACELFGLSGIILFALSCWLAVRSSGASGIYHSQKLSPKAARRWGLADGATLEDLRTARWAGRRGRLRDRFLKNQKG